MQTAPIKHIRVLNDHGIDFASWPSTAECIDKIVKEWGFDVRIECGMNNVKAEISLLGWKDYASGLEEALDATLDRLMEEKN